jgi:cytoskeletal protein CcmA (bactofilin family)
MVFNRKPDPVPPDVVAPQMRSVERSGGVQKQSLHTVSPGASTQSVIGSDLSIEGQTITIRCKGSLKVLGNIQADLHSKELEVGKEATIQGAIAADTVDVYGRVNGSILGTHVVLHSSAEVEGDIHSHLLSIEEGAAFDGRSRRVVNPAEIAPQLERPAPGLQASQHGVVPMPPHHLSS